MAAVHITSDDRPAENSADPLWDLRKTWESRRSVSQRDATRIFRVRWPNNLLFGPPGIVWSMTLTLDTSQDSNTCHI